VIVVGIESSTPQTSVAIGTELEIFGEVAIAGKARQESIAPALEQLLRWTGLELSQVEGVAVGVGPGLFTGLRVGVQTAKTLAHVLRVPIVGLGSLDVLAHGVREARRRIAAVIDGRRGEVFFATYRTEPSGVIAESEPVVATPAGLVSELEAHSGEVLAVGNGAILYHDEIAELGPRVSFASPVVAHPRAAELVELAAALLLLEDQVPSAGVVPVYLRKSDAEIAWDQRARGVSA
jgi:tRNA threonylcarbamoyladenosine biosynthesis protein TsaB